MDTLEKVYLAGFPALMLFVAVFPLARSQSSPNQVPSSNASNLSTDGFSGPEPKHDMGQSTAGTSAMEFLPLMATSIYCAIGLVWSFMRLGFIYLQEETKYQGQLSEIK